MNKEYYIPKESELFVGYECEEYNQYGISNTFEIKKVWEKLKINTPQTLASDIFYNKLETGAIRTPYLTSSDIEKEGWTNQQDISKGWYTFSISGLKQNSGGWEKGDKFYMYPYYSLNIYPENKIVISDESGDTIYSGEYKSINEFRTLQKWLKIK